MILVSKHTFTTRVLYANIDEVRSDGLLDEHTAAFRCIGNALATEGVWLVLAGSAEGVVKQLSELHKQLTDSKPEMVYCDLGVGMWELEPAMRAHTERTKEVLPFAFSHCPPVR